MADKMSKLILPVKTGNTIAPKEFDVGGGGNTFVGTTAEWNALTAEQQNVYDCRVLTDDDLATKSVIDNLTSDSATDALSAKQGKVLAQRSIKRFVSTVNGVTSSKVLRITRNSIMDVYFVILRGMNSQTYYTALISGYNGGSNRNAVSELSKGINITSAEFKTTGPSDLTFEIAFGTGVSDEMTIVICSLYSDASDYNVTLV